MAIQYAQGDIFRVGTDGGYDFLLVFGHIGLNEMGHAWKVSKDRFAHLSDIHDPFLHSDGPVSYSPGKWIQFVPEEKNHGMGQEQLQKIIDESFSWAAKKKLRSVITNGIKDTDHGLITAENRASDDRRVKDIDELVRSHTQNFDLITLISLNDAFTRNFRTNPLD